MEEAELDTRLRAWGNSYGIIIPAELARRLNLRPGEPVHVKLSHEPARNDASRLPKWKFPPYDVDAILDKDLGS